MVQPDLRDADDAASVHSFIHSFIHSLLVKLTYRSRTPDSSGYTIQTSSNLITVFIQCSCNEVFITEMMMCRKRRRQRRRGRRRLRRDSATNAALQLNVHIRTDKSVSENETYL